jgi:hypothetical protein
MIIDLSYVYLELGFGGLHRKRVGGWYTLIYDLVGTVRMSDSSPSYPELFITSRFHHVDVSNLLLPIDCSRYVDV